MSTETDARVEADPFRYGYRFVARKMPDGRVQVDEVPLTLDDLLFPQEGDHEMHSPEHIRTCLHLYAIFEERLDDVPGARVLTDCRVDYGVPGVKPVGPDIAVFLGIHDPFRSATLDVSELGGRPVLVVEVTSPETRKNDFGVKKDIYHRAGVPLYVIIDFRPTSKLRPKSLHGFRDTPGGYEPIAPDEHDRLWLEPLNLWLAIADDRVVCIDGETGEEIGDYRDQVRGRRDERTRADAAEARVAAQQRIIDAQQKTIDALQSIADSAQARADAEVRTRLELEPRLQAMEEAIRKLQGG